MNPIEKANALVVICSVAAFLSPQPIHYRFMYRLKKEYPELWEFLGRPSFWNDVSIWDGWPIVNYLWKRKYLSWPHPDARALCESYRLPMIVGFFCVVASIAILFGGLILIHSYPNLFS